MKVTNTLKIYFVCLSFVLFLASCGDYLALNPDNKFTTVENLVEVQALLDNFGDMNEAYAESSAWGTDTYYLTTDKWKSLSFDYHRKAYLWQGSDEDPPDGSWSNQYKVILNANIALEALSKMNRSEDPFAWDNIKGSALFFRSFYFLNLAQVFISPYKAATAQTDLGLPLRQSSDPEIKSVRSTVQETYDRITTDLREAAQLLPDLGIVTSRPSKAAAYGTLARTFLAMQEYDSALKYSDKCLGLYNELIDYNSLNAGTGTPIQQFNAEEIFYSRANSQSFIITPFYMKVDTMFYNTYDNDDLRKVVCFTDNFFASGSFAFKGDYSGSSGKFSGYIYGGIATDEMYLIRAECYARAGDVNNAMQDLNTLLEKRWVTGTFTPLTATDQKDAIKQIIDERKKELLFRGLRWTDIRRLVNTEFAISPKRVIDGQEYVLSPDNPESRYTFLVPMEVIKISGMQQNE